MKTPKPDVDYRLGSWRQHCGGCSMYRQTSWPPAMGGSCTAVAGPIMALAVCDLWKRRQGQLRRE